MYPKLLDGLKEHTQPFLAQKSTGGVQRRVTQPFGLKYVFMVSLMVFLPYYMPRAVTLAQTDIIWDYPRNLSDSPFASAHPTVVTDSYGIMHVVWNEDVGGTLMESDEQGSEGNTLFYARFDGTSWTTPVDLFYMPGEPVSDFPRLAIDSSQRLHLVWTGVENIYYSSAPALAAYSAQKWTPPAVISENGARSRFESSVAIDAAGIVHVVYAGRGEESGVWHRRSVDGGTTWQRALELSRALRTGETAYSTVMTVVDPENVMHAVWQTSDEDGFGRGVYYSRSINEGVGWEEPRTIKYTEESQGFVGWPFLFASSAGPLHLIYAREDNVGRYYRTSLDNGESWSEEQVILTEMEGINGYVFPLEDSASGLYLIVNMRTRTTQEVGIYYSAYEHNSWSPAIAVAKGEPFGPSAHYAAGAVRLGNELHVVWTQLRYGEIWHTRGLINDVLSPTVVPFAEDQEQLVMEPTYPVSVTDPVQTININEQQQVPDTSGWQGSGPPRTSSAIPLLFSLTTSLFVAGVVLLWKRARA